MTLTRQAAPEAPVVRTARGAFEPEMVPVPAGSFMMGTSPAQVKEMLQRFDWAKEANEKGWFKEEQPEREVTLPAFEIGRYPVTNAQYAEFVRAALISPGHWPEGRVPDELAGHPVVNVTWRDAMAYAVWLSEKTGKSYRLPTEAEWEKATRGDDSRLWPWGNDWDPDAPTASRPGRAPRPWSASTRPGATAPAARPTWPATSGSGVSPSGVTIMPHQPTMILRGMRCVFCAGVRGTTKIPPACGAPTVAGAALAAGPATSVFVSPGVLSGKHPVLCSLHSAPCGGLGAQPPAVRGADRRGM